jgi:RNA recognition motif-containing protein
VTARLFVDNLPVGTTEEALRALFERHGGPVTHVSIMTDRRSGDSHGYAVVEMASEEGAASAVAALHQSTLRGALLHVSTARPRVELRKVER